MNKFTLIGLIGRTNSGKSTLLNNFIGKKIAAVSNRVNTTRTPLSGIYKTDTNSFLILDAPGVCQVKTVLDRLIFQNILKIVEISDVIWWMISCEDQWKKDNQILAKVLENTKKPVLLLLNKVDLIEKNILLKHIQNFSSKFPFNEVVPLSAKKKINFHNLIKATEKYLPSFSVQKNIPNFSLNTLSEIASEIIREQILLQIKDEIPHQTALLKERFFQNKQNTSLFFTLLVGSSSQKAIVIGKNGERVRQIRLKSQELLIKIWKKKVSIFLQIKVSEKWFQDVKILQKLGINWDNYEYTRK